MMLEISELLLPAIVIQILQAIKELVCHTFNNKKLYPKTSAGNMRQIAASNSFVAQTGRYLSKYQSSYHATSGTSYFFDLPVNSLSGSKAKKMISRDPIVN